MWPAPEVDSPAQADSTRPALALAWIADKGRGVVALRSLPRDEPLIQFRGPIAPASSVSDLDHWLQVGPGTFLGPSGGLDDFVNHACDPNCGLFEEADGPMLRSLQPIQPGDEICFDYSTWMSGGHWSMSCACGFAGCRQTVNDFDTLPEALRVDYLALGCVPAFLLVSSTGS